MKGTSYDLIATRKILISELTRDMIKLDQQLTNKTITDKEIFAWLDGLTQPELKCAKHLAVNLQFDNKIKKNSLLVDIIKLTKEGK